MKNMLNYSVFLIIVCVFQYFVLYSKDDTQIIQRNNYQQPIDIVDDLQERKNNNPANNAIQQPFNNVKTSVEKIRQAGLIKKYIPKARLKEEIKKNFSEKDLYHFVYLLYCDPLMIRTIKSLMSAEARPDLIERQIRQLIMDLWMQAVQYGLLSSNIALVQHINKINAPLKNHFEAEVRGIIDAASLTQYMEKSLYKKFFSAYTHEYFLTQCMYMPSDIFVHGAFKNLVHARYQIIKLLLQKDQVRREVAKILREYRTIDDEIATYNIEALNSMYGRILEKDIIAEGDSKTAVALKGFWNAHGIEAIGGALQGVFRSGLIQAVAGKINPVMLGPEFAVRYLDEVVNRILFQAPGIFGKDPMGEGLFASSFIKKNKDIIDILSLPGMKKDLNENNKDTATSREAKEGFNALHFFQESNKKGIDPNTLSEKDQQKYMQGMGFYLGKDSSGDAIKDVFEKGNPLLIALGTKKFSKSKAAPYIGGENLYKAELHNQELSERWDKMGDKKIEDLNEQDYSEYKQKRHAFSDAALTIVDLNSNPIAAVTQYIPQVARGIISIVGNWVGASKFKSDFDKNLSIIRLFYVMPVATTGLSLYRFYSSVKQFIDESVGVKIYSAYLKLLVRKIDCVKKLITIAQKHFGIILCNTIPEIINVTKLFLHKENQEKLKEVYNQAGRYYATWLAISHMNPFYVPYLYHELIESYFGVMYNTEFIRVYGSAYANSLFFKTVDNFVSFFDIITNATNLISDGEKTGFCMPELVEYNHAKTESLVIDVQNMWIPGAAEKSKNSIKLGGGSPQNILITAPIGSGKTFLIKNLLIVLYLANIGIAPCDSVKLTIFNDLFQSNSHIYNALKAGISKNMGERMFVTHVLKIISKAREKDPNNVFFVLLDEFFSGTSPEQALVLAEKMIVPYWLSPNLIGVYTTHFDTMINLAKQYQQKIIKGYMEVQEVSPGEFKRMYKFKINTTLSDPQDWWFDPKEVAKRARYRLWSDKKENQILNDIELGENIGNFE